MISLIEKGQRESPTKKRSDSALQDNNAILDAKERLGLMTKSFIPKIHFYQMMSKQVLLTKDEGRMMTQAKDLFYLKHFMKNPAEAQRLLNECFMDMKNSYSQMDYVFVGKEREEALNEQG